MRYIDINQVVAGIPLNVNTSLNIAHQALINGNDAVKQNNISNGNTIWRLAKTKMEGLSNRKCWYTESENPGCLNDIDHFRPKAQKLNEAGNIDYWYWFLAFDPENYRLSCQFSNRPNENSIFGQTGGKGDKFPLLNGQAHATDKAGIITENPVLLDPCNASDCELLEFQADGRPVVSESYRNNDNALYRVEQSKLLLNLDFPTFNEDRETLYNKIKKLVKRGDYYEPGNPALEHIKEDLRDLIHEDSEYSKAAECYVRCFRDREWVEEMFII